jgi:hypothetical protein
LLRRARVCVCIFVYVVVCVCIFVYVVMTEMVYVSLKDVFCL